MICDFTLRKWLSLFTEEGRKPWTFFNKEPWWKIKKGFWKQQLIKINQQLNIIASVKWDFTENIGSVLCKGCFFFFYSICLLWLKPWHCCPPMGLLTLRCKCTAETCRCVLGSCLVSPDVQVCSFFPALDSRRNTALFLPRWTGMWWTGMWCPVRWLFFRKQWRGPQCHGVIPPSLNHELEHELSNGQFPWTQWTVHCDDRSCTLPTNCLRKVFAAWELHWKTFITFPNICSVRETMQGWRYPTTCFFKRKTEGLYPNQICYCHKYSLQLKPLSAQMTLLKEHN